MEIDLTMDSNETKADGKLALIKLEERLERIERHLEFLRCEV